jgi:hypothetical protein
MSDAYKLADRLEELYIGVHITEAAKKLRELQQQVDSLEETLKDKNDNFHD